MSLTIPVAAARLRREVADAEAALDTALSKIAAITVSIVTSRNTCDLPAHTGQAALIRLQAAQSKLAAVQHDVFRAHDDLTRVGREVMGPEEPYKPGYMAKFEPHPDAAAMTAEVASGPPAIAAAA